MRVSNQGSPPHNFQGNHHLACTQSSCEPRFRLRNRKLLRQLIPLRYSCCCAWASTWRIPSEATHAWGPTGIDTGTRRCDTSGMCPTWGSVGCHCRRLIFHGCHLMFSKVCHLTAPIALPDKSISYAMGPALQGGWSYRTNSGPMISWATDNLYFDQYLDLRF